MVAWGELNEQKCPHCGRPLYQHEGQTPADYHVARVKCPAAERLDTYTAEYRRRNKAAIESASKAGRDADAGALWLTFTEAEGVPSFGWTNPKTP
jgi:uncharacterized Zn finger protein (UPF0148 family)